jgi:hypothetical protein
MPGRDRPVAFSGSVEQLDDRRRQASKIADFGNEVVAMYRSSFAERYVQANVYLAIRMAGVGSRKHGFLIKAMPFSGGDWVGKSDKADPSREHECFEQSAVFSGEVQIMEAAQRVIPSRIWPEIFDDNLIDLGKPLYLFQDETLGVSEVDWSFPDGEISTFGFREAVACCHGAGQQVETAANAMNDGASLSVYDRVKRLDIAKAVKLFAGLRIGINHQGIGFVSFPGDKTLRKLIALGYGPIDSGLSV